MKKKILFVCIENSCRSQMAQAFAQIHNPGNWEVYSAGSRPSGKVNPKAITSMQEIGYDLSTHDSKSLDEVPNILYDFVATMGCGDNCPWVQSKIREDWAIPDPKNMESDEFRKIREMIEIKVKDLVGRL
ncbi:MAG: arsenate reductase ArsC [Deltaproteobacteria bacterium]|nr:arsenate reductase ArsC [Deltaproteobacteria bacterium]